MQRINKVFTSLLLGLFILSISSTNVIAQTPVAKDTADVTLTINDNVNINNIIAYKDSGTTQKNIPITVDVPINDKAFNSELDLSSITIVTPSPNGSAEIVNNKIKFTPSKNFVGSTQLKYRICNLQNTCDEALVDLIVLGDVTNIKANPDNATTYQNQSVLIDVTKNDELTNSSFNYNELKVVTSSPNGTTQVITNKINFTPNNNYLGTTQFTYRICNTDDDCDEAVVTVLVKPLVLDTTPITGGNALISIGLSSSILALFLVVFITTKQKRKDPAFDNSSNDEKAD